MAPDNSSPMCAPCRGDDPLWIGQNANVIKCILKQSISLFFVLIMTHKVLIDYIQ